MARKLPLSASHLFCAPSTACPLFVGCVSPGPYLFLVSPAPEVSVIVIVPSRLPLSVAENAVNKQRLRGHLSSQAWPVNFVITLCQGCRGSSWTRQSIAEEAISPEEPFCLPLCSVWMLSKIASGTGKSLCLVAGPRAGILCKAISQKLQFNLVIMFYTSASNAVAPRDSIKAQGSIIQGPLSAYKGKAVPFSESLPSLQGRNCLAYLFWSKDLVWFNFSVLIPFCSIQVVSWWDN